MIGVWLHTFEFWIPALIVTVVAYLMGCFNGAVIISKYILRDDIRNHGSGNAGLTNFIRNYGAASSILVIATDVGKAYLACMVGGGLLASKPTGTGNGDYDITLFDEKAVEEYGLADLRLGDIVLLEEICRRVEHADVAEVDFVHCALAIPFADDGHVLTHTKDCEVTCKRNRLKDSHLVALNRECARRIYFTDN